jgi:hypothetical protein
MDLSLHPRSEPRFDAPPISPPVPAPEPPRARRCKLWELHHKYHCPVIGTCLEVAELRRIAARTRQRSDGRLTDFEVHLNFVGAADTKNTLSIATHKALERKCASAIGRFAKVRDSAGLMALWHEALASGGAPGALWALVTHPRADAQVLAQVYGDIHMLSHQIGAGQRADLAQLTQTRAELAELQDRHAATLRRHACDLDARDRELAVLRGLAGESEALRVREKLLQARVAKLESGQALRDATARLGELEPRLSRLEQDRERALAEATDWRDRCETAESRCLALQRDLEEQAAEAQVLEGLLLSDLAQPCDTCLEGDCRTCPNLEGRRVLCVGGRHAQTTHFRALVARCNGRFERHDGGMEDSRARLEAMLAAADAVVCPADCVSHDAYHRVKRFCKRHGKPCVLLNGSGTSAFARALERLARMGDAVPDPEPSLLLTARP